MKRRDFIARLGGAAAGALVAPLPLAAQPSQVWRIGMLDVAPAAANAANLNALRKGLRDLGYIEGQNLTIDYRSADGRTERFAELAAELVRLKVDLIVTRGTPALHAARNATATIPVVMAASGDPLLTGIVAGLARPGGNVTGVSAFTVELHGKRIEMLREAVPGLSRIAILHNLDNPIARVHLGEFKAASQSLNFEGALFDVRKREDLEGAFDAMVAQGAKAVVVGNDTLTSMNRALVVALAAKHRLPSVYMDRDFVEAGGLMTYGVSYPDLYRRAAAFIDKIFKGANPGDLPVEQPTKFELIINLKTAKALGLAIPESFLVRCDEVIE